MPWFQATIWRPPVRLEAAGKPIDTEVGHAAPLVYDFDGDGVQDLLVGQFGGGVLWIYPQRRHERCPQAGGRREVQAGGEGRHCAEWLMRRIRSMCHGH